ncbi:ankyrin repeat-containing domain protein [Bisporella sp. PMI_857]|nr:ankyrin repeat-containing domain protein [Bisporella sp. PMI_857]
MATLQSAVFNQNLKQLEEILNSNPSPSQKDLNDALGWAASEDGHVDAILPLFTHGAQITGFSSHSAASSHNPVIFELFMKNGWNINSTEFKGPVLLFNVNNEDCVRWLLEHGANPNLKGHDNTSALSSAALQPSTAILDLLISYGAKIEVDALLRAISPRGQGGLPIMRYLIEHGINVNEIDPVHGTPLHFAVRLKQKDKVRLLVEKGADPLIKFHGKTPAQMALEKGLLDIHELLSD